MKISAVFIAIDVRSRFNCIADDFVYRLQPLFGNDVRADLASLAFIGIPFQQTEHGLLSGAASATAQRFASTIRMHIASKTTDVRFIYFDSFAFSAHLLEAALL